MGGKYLKGKHFIHFMRKGVTVLGIDGSSQLAQKRLERDNYL